MDANLSAIGCQQRKIRYARVIAFYLAALVFLFCTCSATWAQSNSNESDWRTFVDSVGKALYFDAWPTATYQSVTFGDVAVVPNGVDVSFVLHGISAFDDGPLWTEVVLEMRDGKISNLRWGRNNAVLAAPGSTMKALGQALDQLNQQYDQQHSMPATGGMPISGLSAICLTNPTDNSITYSLTVDGAKQDHTLPSKTFLISTSNSPNADFVLDYDSSFADGYQGRTIHIPGTPRAQTPTTCDDDLEYDFVVEDPLIGLNSKKWVPGFEHPFLPNVVRTQKDGEWTCVDGQTWANPGDSNDLTCVPK